MCRALQEYWDNVDTVEDRRELNGFRLQALIALAIQRLDAFEEIDHVRRHRIEDVLAAEGVEDCGSNQRFVGDPHECFPVERAGARRTRERVASVWRTVARKAATQEPEGRGAAHDSSRSPTIHVASASDP